MTNIRYEKLDFLHFLAGCCQMTTLGPLDSSSSANTKHPRSSVFKRLNEANKLPFTLSDLNILNAWQVQARFGPLSWCKIYYSWRRWPCHSHSVTLYPSFPVPCILTAETTSNIEIIYNFFCQACVIPLYQVRKLSKSFITNYFVYRWKKSMCHLSLSVN